MDLKAIVRELETPSLEETPSTKLVVGDIEKLASIMEKTAEDNDSLTKFATGVRILADEFKELVSKRAVAEEVVAQLVKQGSLETTNIFSKLSELEDKDTQELKILNEALKLSKTASFVLGSLSGQTEAKQDYGNNPKEALERIIEKIKGD